MPPRQSLPGQTLHITRRTVGRHYYLSPSIETAKVTEYAYAVAIEESEQVPHASVLMSNHPHNHHTDPNARRSEFTERFHGIIGRYLNDLLGREGAFWDNRRTSETVLLHDPERSPFEDDDDLVEQLDNILLEIATERDLDIHQITSLYIWMNPVKANLVDQVRQWPGFTILPDIWGERQTVFRPAIVGPGYPEKASYTPQPPPGAWSEMPIEEARADALALIALAEDRYREKRHREGKRVLGPKAARNQDPHEQPPEMRLPVSERRRTRRPPRFSGHPENVRKAKLAYCAYCKNHRVAARKFRAGQRDVLFPAGAVGMQRIAGVHCRRQPLAVENPMP